MASIPAPPRPSHGYPGTRCALNDLGPKFHKTEGRHQTQLSSYALVVINRSPAKLPGHFLSMAVSGRATGWQQLETLVARHKSYCEATVRTSEEIAMREQAL